MPEGSLSRNGCSTPGRALKRSSISFHFYNGSRERSTSLGIPWTHGDPEHASLDFSKAAFSRGTAITPRLSNLLCLASQVEMCMSFQQDCITAIPCSKASHGSVHGRNKELGCLAGSQDLCAPPSLLCPLLLFPVHHLHRVLCRVHYFWGPCVPSIWMRHSA